MADIRAEIKNFKEAVYGEDVRGSMISLAEKVNGEIEKTTSWHRIPTKKQRDLTRGLRITRRP